jgi:hypothetical protein
MISRAGRLPWKVPVPVTAIPLITADEWVIGVHETWDRALEIDARLVGLRRDEASHRESLKRFGMSYESCVEIVNSLPADFTVDYSALVAGDAQEMGRLHSLTGLSGIQPEPQEKRYSGPFDWCRAG